jgi:GT2 family glycosyltransferase
MAIQFATEKFNPDFFMVLDPDAIFPPHAVRMMIERLGGEPGVVAARMEKGPKYPIRHDSLFYSFVFFERRVFEKVGLYEPAFFAYYDDPFVGIKVLRAGFPIFNEPSFAYIHRGMHSTRQIRGLRSYMRMRNWFLYNRLTSTRLRTFLLHPFRASRNLAAAVQLGGANEFQLSFLGYISGMILLLSRGKHDRMKRIAEPLMSYKLCLQ